MISMQPGGDVCRVKILLLLKAREGGKVGDKNSSFAAGREGVWQGGLMKQTSAFGNFYWALVG